MELARVFQRPTRPAAPIEQRAWHLLTFNRRTVTAILRGRLPSSMAKERARLMLEDAPRLGCPLRWLGLDCGDGQVWPYYMLDGLHGHAGRSRLSAPAGTQAAGYGLNWGDGVTLSQVVSLARGLWGWRWVERFRNRMSSIGNHLAAVEELWWLGRWASPANIRQECRPFAGCDCPVDWQFETSGMAINLEVKYRAYDWLRWVDARQVPSLDACFNSVAAKFPRRNPGQLNLELPSRCSAHLAPC